MKSSVEQKALVTIAALLAALYAAVAVQNFVGNGADGTGIWPGIASTILAVLIIAGLLVTRRSPMLGDILLFLGAAPLAIGMYWTIVFPLLAVLLMIVWIVNVRRLASER